MKGKRLLILGAAFALGLSACAGATRITRANPLRSPTAATMAKGDNAYNDVTVNSKSAIKCGTGSAAGSMTITIASSNAKTL